LKIDIGYFWGNFILSPLTPKNPLKVFLGFDDRSQKSAKNLDEILEFFTGFDYLRHRLSVYMSVLELVADVSYQTIHHNIDNPPN
jgi:hypothetical protein